MENDIMNRQGYFYEHLSTMQTLCIFILLLGFIKYKHTFIFYPPNGMHIFFGLLFLIGLGTVLLYNSFSFRDIKIRGSQPQDNSNHSSLIKYVYTIIPFLIALILLFIRGNGLLVESIFILPVLFAATVLGKKASYAMAATCTLVLILNQSEVKVVSLMQSLESNIFLICAMFTVGWFVGGLMDIEAQDRNQVKQSVLSLKEEIDRREQMEKEMARLDRLNLIGEMAAGIGHEIRNPMTTVRGFLQLMQEKERYAQDREFLTLMISELDRANSIISEFLSLAKNKAVDLKEQSLNSIIETLFPLIQADAMVSDKNITIDLEEIPDLFLDEKEIRQLILNLARNGFEAMPAGGELKIRTFTVSEETILAVQDQGKGIDRDILDKIGTPFFTTKDTGTGLGLAVCYSIAARHNAEINVETATTGTTFYVRFKILEPKTDSKTIVQVS
ncbi:ATP-binding protein [Pelotomaculum propionicicum]